MTMRLSMSSLAGTARTQVAVGTSSEDSMLVTTRALAPRRGVVWLVRPAPVGLGLARGVRCGLGRARASLAAVRGRWLPARRGRLVRRPRCCGRGLAAGRLRGPGGAGDGAGAGASAGAGAGPLRSPCAGAVRRRRLSGRRRLTRAVVLEEVPPRAVDAVAVLRVLLVQLVDQPLVGSEGGQGVAGRGLLGHGGCASFSSSRGRRKSPLLPAECCTLEASLPRPAHGIRSGPSGQLMSARVVRQMPRPGQRHGVGGQHQGAAPPLEATAYPAPAAGGLDHRVGGLRRDEARCARARTPRRPEAKPEQRLDDPGHADADEQGRHLVGDEDADAEADERPEPEHQQAERERADDRLRRGRAGCRSG